MKKRMRVTRETKTILVLDAYRLVVIFYRLQEIRFKRPDPCVKIRFRLIIRESTTRVVKGTYGDIVRSRGCKIDEMVNILEYNMIEISKPARRYIG